MGFFYSSDYIRVVSDRLGEPMMTKKCVVSINHTFIILLVAFQNSGYGSSCAAVSLAGAIVTPPTTQVNLVQLPPQFTNVTVVNNTNAATLCTPSLQVTDSTVVYDMATPGKYNNFHDYDVALRANRSVFPAWGNELIITPTYLVFRGNDFGSAVALSGDGSTLAVGSTAAFVNNGGSQSRGADTVSLYRRIQNSWVFIQQISPTVPPPVSPTPLVGFGTSVALSYDGSLLAIGAPGSTLVRFGSPLEPTNGTVYLYAYGSANGFWNLSQTIPGQTIGFGVNVDLSATGQYLAICTNSSLSSSVNETPSVTVYERQSMCTNIQAPWIFQAQLTPVLNSAFFSQKISPAAQYKHMALSADGTTIALGCSGANVVDGNTYVFLFQRTGSTWLQTQTIASALNGFGMSVALSASGKYLAVGLADITDISIYTRRGTMWQLEAALSPFVNIVTSLSFSADGTVLVAGGDTENSSAGALALMVRGPDNRWSTVTRFPGSTITEDQLGWSCACSADGAIIAGGATQNANLGTGYAVVLRSIGATIPNDTVVSGSLCVYHRTTLDSTLKVVGNIHLQGTLITGTAGHVTACTVPTVSPSDKRIKDDIAQLDPHKVLEIIRSLRPIHFSFNDSTEIIRHTGFIAQELEQLLPHCVKTQTTADGREVKMIYLHHEFYVYLIGALQEIAKRTQANREKLASL
jgi:WD40 repeat protein